MVILLLMSALILMLIIPITEGDVRCGVADALAQIGWGELEARGWGNLEIDEQAYKS